MYKKLFENKPLTAFFTDYYGKKGIMIKNDYPNKNSFFKDLKANGYRNIRIYDEEDLKIFDRSDLATEYGIKTKQGAYKYLKSLETKYGKNSDFYKDFKNKIDEIFR